jgi:energy-coupling factor transport system permease protein
VSRAGFLDTPVLRYVERRSIVHRIDARAKILVLLTASLTVMIAPTWTSVGLMWAAIITAFMGARLPIGVLPKPPRIFVVAIAISAGVAVYGGDGEAWARSTALFLGLLLVANLLAWTTPADRLAAGVRWWMRPFARLPVVGDAVAGLTLAVRGVAIVLDELRLTWVGWRTRNPGVTAPTLRQAVDLVAAAIVGVTRRARDLDTAAADRGR